MNTMKQKDFEIFNNSLTVRKNNFRYCLNSNYFEELEEIRINKHNIFLIGKYLKRKSLIEKWWLIIEIYIVRHGQTDYNLLGRIAGRIDIPLNDKGKQNAYDVKKKLKDIKFDKVYSSPLIRAYETAKIITNLPIIKDKRIIERDNGELEGRLKSEIIDMPDFNDPNETKYNIENIIDFKKRINDFLDDITKEDCDNILIVTHAGVGIYMRCFFEGDPKDNNYISYKINNGEIIKYHVRWKN